jgi:hypothetical protein
MGATEEEKEELCTVTCCRINQLSQHDASSDNFVARRKQCEARVGRFVLKKETDEGTSVEFRVIFSTSKHFVVMAPYSLLNLEIENGPN